MSLRRKATFALSLVVILTCYPTATQAYGNHEKDILKHLLDNYGSKVSRPVRNASHSIKVQMRVLIAQIVNFDEPRQQLTINAWQKMAWRDEFLVWNPDDFGGQDVAFVLPSEIWTPRLVLLENVNYEFPSFELTEIEVLANGSITWYTPAMFQFSCKVYVKKFPFDVQQCNMTFMPWAYSKPAINLLSFDDEDSYQYIFSQNGVWNLISVNLTQGEVFYACCGQPFTRVVHTLTFKRLSLAYVFSILIPSILLAMNTLMVFGMPPNSGEKISLGMTNLLAFVVFQELIGGSMPPIGDDTPLLTMYMFSMVVIGCASIFTSVLVLRLFHADPEQPLPSRVVSFMEYVGKPKHALSWQSLALLVDKVMLLLFLFVTVLIIVIFSVALAIESDDHSQ